MKTSTPPSHPIASISRCKAAALTGSRATMPKRAPLEARSRAASLPNPLVAPVRTIFPIVANDAPSQVSWGPRKGSDRLADSSVLVAYLHAHRALLQPDLRCAR